MAERKRCLMIGAGGMAGAWIRRFFPTFADRLEVVGLVDVREDVLQSAGDFLGLPSEHRFTEMARAFDAVETLRPDFCAIVVPPWAHREAALLAAERRLPILSEKPIADTWEACCDVYQAVRAAGVKMAVIQNYRYEAPLLTFRQGLREGRIGRLDYLVGRFAADYRRPGAWGAFRHEIPHSLLVEGAVHHFDMLRNLAGADPIEIAGWEWNPAWSSFRGECNAIYTLAFANGVRAVYEGSCNAAGTQNTWHFEHYRAEGESGSLSVDRDRIVRLHTQVPQPGAGPAAQGLRTEELPPVRAPYEGHNWLIDEFLRWLDGGPTPDTELAENLKSVALVFAAVEAARSRRVVDVREFVASSL